VSARGAARLVVAFVTVCAVLILINRCMF